MVNNGSKKGNFSHDCYTCHKTPFIQKHVLLQTDTCEIHASINCTRRRLTVTPRQHVSDISDLGAESFMEMYITIKKFLQSFGVTGFEMSFKTGDWMRHDHQHSHILIEDQYLDQILKHFNLMHDIPTHQGSSTASTINNLTRNKHHSCSQSSNWRSTHCNYK